MGMDMPMQIYMPSASAEPRMLVCCRCSGRKPVDVAIEEKQRGFMGMLAAFISPPPPREQKHFEAILRLATFFEDLAGDSLGDVRKALDTPAGDGQTRHLKPITVRTMAGAAAQRCLDELRPNDSVVRTVRRAGYDSEMRPLGCPHGMFKSCAIASDDEEVRNTAWYVSELSARSRRDLASSRCTRSWDDKVSDTLCSYNGLRWF